MDHPINARNSSALKGEKFNEESVSTATSLEQVRVMFDLTVPGVLKFLFYFS